MISIPFFFSFQAKGLSLKFSFLQCSSKEDKVEESKRNLSRRGLCLVPLSYASYFNSYDGSMEANTP